MKDRGLFGEYQGHKDERHNFCLAEPVICFSLPKQTIKTFLKSA